MPGLVQLDLAETAISDDVLGYFRKMPNLQEVNLIGTRVTQPGIDQLRRRLPKMNIRS